MDAKSYLDSIRNLNELIENKQLEIFSLKSLLESITAKPKEVNVQTSLSNDKMADTISKIVDLQNELNADIDRYADMKIEAIRLINKMSDPKNSALLIHRHINCEKFDDIAEKLGITIQGLDYRYKKAVNEFQIILNNSV